MNMNNNNNNHHHHQIRSDGEMADNNQFGMAGLLPILRSMETSPDIARLALGHDLTKLGLNLNSSKRNLYQTFGGPWADFPCGIQDLDAKVPEEYLTNATIRDKLPNIKLNKMHEDVLFYLFYNCPGEVYQVAAASELYTRDWRYHKVERFWLQRAPYSAPPREIGGSYERSHQYNVFDPILWKKVPREIAVLDYKDLEGKPSVPGTSSSSASSSSWSNVATSSSAAAANSTASTGNTGGISQLPQQFQPLQPPQQSSVNIFTPTAASAAAAAASSMMMMMAPSSSQHPPHRHQHPHQQPSSSTSSSVFMSPVEPPPLPPPLQHPPLPQPAPMNMNNDSYRILEQRVLTTLRRIYKGNTMARNEMRFLMDCLSENPEIFGKSDFSGQFLNFLQYEPEVAGALLVYQLLYERDNYYGNLELLLNMTISVQVLIAVNKFVQLCEYKSLQFPKDFVNRFISMCITICDRDASHTDVAAHRLVRMVCVFFSALLSLRHFDPSMVRSEIQNFATTYLSLREASQLYQKTLLL